MNKDNSSFLILFSKGPRSGYGHYSRSKIIQEYIKYNIKAPVKISCIKDSEVSKKNISKIIKNKIKKDKIKTLILDLNFIYLKSVLKIRKMLLDINKMGIVTIGIDSLRFFYKYLNYVWIPSPFKEKNLVSKNIIYGWDKMILNRYKFTYKRSKKILFLFGSSKNILISKQLPSLIERKIPREFKLHCVLGKYSEKPRILDRDRWTIHTNISSTKNILKKAGFVFSLYGLSLFEALNSGIPTVSFCTKDNFKKDFKEIIFLKKKKMCFIEHDLVKSVEKLNLLIRSEKISKSFIKNCKKVFQPPDYSFLDKI